MKKTVLKVECWTLLEIRHHRTRKMYNIRKNKIGNIQKRSSYYSGSTMADGATNEADTFEIYKIILSIFKTCFEHIAWSYVYFLRITNTNRQIVI